MDLQVDLLAKAGVKRTVAEDLLKKRKGEVERRVISANHTRSVDAARLLDIPFLCAHTVADNCVTKFLQDLLDKKRPKTLADVIKILDTIPEYKIASQNNAGPRILIGDDKKPAGKILVEMTGGTEGSTQAFSRLSQAGVNTLVSMHLSEEHYKVAREQYINVVIAGHISSDNLGLNLLLDKLEQKAKLDFVSCSGFQRIRRK
jgi:putative NIF3 family GTP cyclohydrolase 1 type 2